MHGQRSAAAAQWWGARRVLVVLTVCLGSVSYGQHGLRQLHVGDTMPELSLTDPNGTVFRYEHGRSAVLGLIILQAGQTHLDRLVADVKSLVPELRSHGTAFDCVGVMCGPGAGDYVRSHAAEAKDVFPIVADPGFAFWGKLGVIAAPTALVVGADHKIQWIKAGYGYDFVAGFHAQLAKALGDNSDATVRVETLENASTRARRDRQIQLARTLAKKGRLELAIEELAKLRQLDPNAVDVALELGEVLCRAGQNEAALKLATQVHPESAADQARVMLISAWARRQAGDAKAAESLLTKALELAPESPRILYELGKVYQTQGNSEKALDCYRRALAGVFADAEMAGSSRK